VTSPVGRWVVEGDDRVVTRVYSPTEFAPPARDPAPDAPRAAAEQIAAYLDGTRRRFDVALAPVDATPFQRDVWRALADVAYGEVRTYAEIAAAVGRPLAARAVGNALNRNPYSLLVPCHRVVAATGLGGYGGGEDVKRFLLALEGVTFD
jgi:methylated-DNA-[protein]-cysteine S-methyltransferase